MKKAIAIFLTALMLLNCAAVGEQIDIEWKIGSGEAADSGSAQLILQEGEWILTSDWIDGYAIAVSELPAESSGAAIADALSSAEAAQAAEAMLQAWQTWTEGRKGETKAGTFSGDAFEEAHSETAYELGWADVSVIIRQAMQTAEDGALKEMLEEADAAAHELAMKSSTRIVCKVYDEGEAFSATMIQAGKTVGTLSGSLKDPENPFFVTGWAEGGKDYYFALELSTADGSVKWKGRLLADDRCDGYRALDERALILSWNGSIREEKTNTTAETEIIPANGTGPILLKCVTEDKQADLSLALQDAGNVIVTVSVRQKDEADSGSLEGKTLVRTDAMSKEEENAIMGALSGRAIAVLYRLMQILPEEMLKVILPGL